MSAMDLLLDQVQTWELPTGACPFLKTCTKALQFSPKWRCNFLHFYFATFGTFILQQTCHCQNSPDIIYNLIMI